LKRKENTLQAHTIPTYSNVSHNSFFNTILANQNSPSFTRETQCRLLVRNELHNQIIMQFHNKGGAHGEE